MIDHIVPESLDKNQEAWNTTRTALGLPETFSLQSYENIAASCHACNDRKRDQVLAYGRLSIELAKAKQNSAKVAPLVEKFQQQDTSEKLRLRLLSAVANGEISEADIADVLVKAKQAAGKFPLTFTDLFPNKPIFEIDRQDIDTYLDRRIELGADFPDGLRMVRYPGGPTDLKGKEEATSVTTLREYEAAVAAGFFALSSYEMHIEAHNYSRPLTVMRAVSNAMLAERSYIDAPRLSVTDLAFVPATLLFTVNDMTSDPEIEDLSPKLKGKSIEQLSECGEAKVEILGEGTTRIVFDGCFTYLFEILRADLNGDGIEDILIHRGGGPIDGTYRSSSTLAITRLTPTAMFTLAEGSGTGAQGG